MSEITPLSNEQLAKLALGDKLGLALKLSLSKFPLYLGLYLLAVVATVAVNFILSLLNPYLGLLGSGIMLVLCAPYGVGILSLVLKHIRGEAYTSVFEVVLEPFQRIAQVLVPILVWYVGMLIIFFVVMFIAMIPILGWIVALAACLFLSILFSCVIFYIADHKNSSIGDSIIKPLTFTLNNLAAWGSAIVASFISYLPAGIVYIFGLFAIIGAGAAAGLSSSNPEASALAMTGVSIGSMILFLIAVLLAVVGTVFFAVNSGISYLQSCARESLKQSGQ